MNACIFSIRELVIAGTRRKNSVRGVVCTHYITILLVLVRHNNCTYTDIAGR